MTPAMVPPEHKSESKRALEAEFRASLEHPGVVANTSSEDTFRLIVETIPGLVAVMTDQARSRTLTAGCLITSVVRLRN